MLSNDLFHPNHVVPTIELLAALMEMSNCLVAQVFMEADTIQRQVFVLRIDEGDTGIHV